MTERKKSTLCWDCANYDDGCSWSRDFTPVKGWNAYKTKGNCYDSYCVVECPEFVRDSVNYGLQRQGESRAQAMAKALKIGEIEPITKAQRNMIIYIMEESIKKPRPFKGYTKKAADEWISENRKFIEKEEEKEWTWWAK